MSRILSTGGGRALRSCLTIFLAFYGIGVLQHYVQLEPEVVFFTTSRLGPGPSQSAKASFLLCKRRKIKFPAELRMESCSDWHVPGYTLYSAGCTQPSTDI